MSSFYSPLRYPGGKNCIFPFMASLLQENGLNGCAYAEPFAGGAGLALHLLLEGIVSEIYLNDLDHSIYSFWNAVINDTDRLCSWIENVSVDMESWKRAKEVYKNMKAADSFDLAVATFFLNRTNISGIITGGPIGGPSQTGKYRIEARFNKRDLIQRIKRISAYKESIHLSELDGMDFLKMLHQKQHQIFIYIDPPYVKKGADLYMNFFDTEQHSTLRDQILRLGKHWIVSYDNADLIRSLYHEQRKYIYSLSQCTSNRVGDELLIFGPNLTLDNAIQKLKNPQLV